MVEKTNTQKISWLYSSKARFIVSLVLANYQHVSLPPGPAEVLRLTEQSGCVSPAGDQQARRVVASLDCSRDLFGDQPKRWEWQVLKQGFEMKIIIIILGPVLSSFWKGSA